MLKRGKPHKAPRDRLHINFSRKILSRATLKTLRDSIDVNGSLRGDAIVGVVDDLIKLRYLCENIVEFHQDGNNESALQGIEMLRLVI